MLVTHFPAGRPTRSPVDAQCLVGRINHGEARRRLSKPLGPPSGAARQLQDIADGAERVQGLDHRLDLSVPLRGIVGAVVIGAAPLPPVVVFGRPRSVEGALLGEQISAVRRPGLHSLILLRPPRSIQDYWLACCSTCKPCCSAI